LRRRSDREGSFIESVVDRASHPELHAVVAARVDHQPLVREPALLPRPPRIDTGVPRTPVTSSTSPLEVTRKLPNAPPSLVDSD
jgi:hypothetical protein